MSSNPTTASTMVINNATTNGTEVTTMSPTAFATGSPQSPPYATNSTDGQGSSPYATSPYGNNDDDYYYYTGGSSGSSSSATVSSTTVESASYTNWMNILHVVLWSIGAIIALFLLFRLVSAVCRHSSSNQPQRPSRRQQQQSSSPDLTDDNKTTTDHGEDEDDDDDDVMDDVVVDVERPSNNNNNNNNHEPTSSCRRHKTYALLLFMTVVGFVLSVMAQTSCDFLVVREYNDGSFPSGGGIDNNFDRIGLWKASPSVGPYQTSDICYSTFRGDWRSGNDDDDRLNLYDIIFEDSWGTPDTALTVSRVMGILSSLIGGLLLLWFWLCMAWYDVPSFIYRKCCTCGGGGRSYHTAVLATTLFVVAIFQMATLCLKSTTECTELTHSHQRCYFDDGAVSAMTAALYWFLASMTAAILPL